MIALALVAPEAGSVLQRKTYLEGITRVHGQAVVGGRQTAACRHNTRPKVTARGERNRGSWMTVALPRAAFASGTVSGRCSRPMAALAQKHPSAKPRRDGPEVRSRRSASHSSSRRADKVPGAARAARANQPARERVRRLAHARTPRLKLANTSLARFNPVDVRR